MTAAPSGSGRKRKVASPDVERDHSCRSARQRMLDEHVWRGNDINSAHAVQSMSTVYSCTSSDKSGACGQPGTPAAAATITISRARAETRRRTNSAC